MEKAEKIGLIVAVTGHVALFGALSFSIFGNTNDAFQSKPIEVMIADEVGLESAAPDPSMVTPATSVAPELGLPEDADFAEAEALPDPPPKPEVKPEPTVRPAPVSREPRRRPDRQASRTTTKPTSQPARKPRGSRLGDDFLKGVTDSASVSRNQNPRAEKASAAAVASLERELYRLVKQKWRPPSGADVELLRTKVTARLDRSGNIVGTPVARTTGITASNRSQVKIHQERAIAAVRLAAPYTSFPEKYYAEWSTIEPVLFIGV